MPSALTDFSIRIALPFCAFPQIDRQPALLAFGVIGRPAINNLFCGLVWERWPKSPEADDGSSIKAPLSGSREFGALGAEKKNYGTLTAGCGYFGSPAAASVETGIPVLPIQNPGAAGQRAQSSPLAYALPAVPRFDPYQQSKVLDESLHLLAKNVRKLLKMDKISREDFDEDFQVSKMR